MIEFQKKNRVKKIIYSPIVLFIILIILILIIRGTWNVYIKDNLTVKSLEREKIELQKINDRELKLVNSIEFLKTEDGIESEIRNKFRAVKSGEKIAVIIDNTGDSTTTIMKTESRNFFYRIFDWFML